MTGTTWATLLVSLGGIVGALYTTWRLARSDRWMEGRARTKESSDQAAVLLGGWRDFQKSTLDEVARVRQLCQEELQQLKNNHESDKARWELERADFHREIEQLKAQLLIVLRETNK